MQYVKPATTKQKVLIQKISSERGLKLKQNIEELTLDEAKVLIDSLVRAKRGNKADYISKSENQAKEIDNVRLGLATKLVYNNWKYEVNSITKDKNVERVFISDVIATYDLLGKIKENIRHRNI